MLESSRLYRTTMAVADRLSTLVRGSYLYRWLTAEPDPEVIVIDLRETWTVGPFIAILDRVFGGLERAAAGSALVALASVVSKRTLNAPVRVAGLVTILVGILAFPSALVLDWTAALLVAIGLLAVGTIALFEDRPWAELRETRPIELLVAAFEPPEPPHLQNGETADDCEPAQADADEPEGDAFDDQH
ncbi:MAG: hypothetical protein ACQET5_14990 [Halobacteriota archaeon]